MQDNEVTSCTPQVTPSNANSKEEPTMNSIAPLLKTVLLATIVFFAVTLPTADVRSAAAPQSPSCSAPEYHQFDFWLGDWDAFDFGGTTKVARLRVDSILDGCVLLENYEGADGHKGQSFSIYDASRKVWHQTWVTNRGELLMIEGAKQGDAMILSGSDRTKDGAERHVRGVWKPENGGVRETAVRSTDGGKTWTPWFDIIFQPHKP